MSDSATDPSNVVAALQRAADEARRRGSPEALDEEMIIEIFERLAPPGATDHGPRGRLRQLGTTQIDVDVPIDTGRRVFVPIKRLLKKLQYWYLRHIADQLNVVISLLAAVLEDHQRRLEEIELGDPRRVGIEPTPDTPSATLDALAARFTGEPGRLLVAWCGRARIVSHLDSVGCDVYGIDPARDLAADAIRQGLDVRIDDPLAHLRRVRASQLGGVIIGPAIDIMPTARVATILDAAHRALADDAHIALVVNTDRGDPLRFELSGVQPRSDVAWTRLLEARGFAAITTDTMDPGVTLITGRR